MERRNYDIILSIDANESMSDQSKWRNFLEEMGLVNCMWAKLGTNCNPNTHQAGRTSIDYVVCSRRPAEAIMAAGYTAFYSGSDHRILWVDFDSRVLFGYEWTETQEIARGIKSKFRKQAIQFKKEVALECQRMGLFESIDELYNKTEWSMLDEQELEYIDKEFGTVLKTVDKNTLKTLGPHVLSSYHMPLKLCNYGSYENDRRQQKRTSRRK